ncbi:MAG: flagellar biosynthetic protein FliR [Pseudomonadota bacterium]
MFFSEEVLLALVNAYFWPFVRIGGLVAVAPLFNSRSIPPRVKLLLVVSLTMLIAPALPPMPDVPLMSPAGFLLTGQQLLIGMLLGFVVQLVFDAMVVAGETAAMSMGLGFATFLDPERGVSVPVLSQFYLILATLTYLAINGHLMLLEVLAQSFLAMPVAVPENLQSGQALLWELIGFASTMFGGALQIALPAVCALLIVNIAFGVISRAAPSLNMFAIGFPVSLVMGFAIILVALPSTQGALIHLLEVSFGLLTDILRP